MSVIYEFGTAPEARKLGYRVVGIVKGTKEEVLEMFFGDVILVIGGGIYDDVYEFYVMVKGD